MLIKSFKPDLTQLQSYLETQSDAGNELFKPVISNDGISGYTLEQFLIAKQSVINSLPRASVFDNDHITPSTNYPAEERLVSGKPLRTTWSHHEDDANGFYCGLWQSEVGSWRFSQPANQTEYFTVLTGRIRLHNASGGVIEIQAGQSAVIPAGFKGIFEVVQAVRKQYAILIKA